MGLGLENTQGILQKLLGILEQKLVQVGFGEDDELADNKIDPLHLLQHQVQVFLVFGMALLEQLDKAAQRS
ncbi:hypothetical protein D3C75_892820 [compost metagenome]